jgi:hypothetical protein
MVHTTGGCSDKTYRRIAQQMFVDSGHGTHQQDIAFMQIGTVRGRWIEQLDVPEPGERGSNLGDVPVGDDFHRTAPLLMRLCDECTGKGTML